MKDLAEAIIPVIAIIFTFGIPGIIVFWYIHNKHQERMKIIEKGLTPEEARAILSPSERGKPARTYVSLKWGIVLLSLGLGIFISYVLEEVYDMSDSFTFALTLLFLGLGFIVYYLIVNAKTKKENASKIQGETVQ
jgi:hypothetical protein